ncbi:beta strand repeat-containing protein [Novipirellula sp. SH528]|uniref:beta strand repeat-containing protein n=1 Tax=Novipirellula sp. SH528 TaxID=3454466 RepID=UPI003FA13910
MMVFKRLINRLGRKSQTVTRKKSNRRLLMEHLTRRELMASDLGAISGLAYTDADGNGQLDAGEVRLGNLTVQVYRDNGAGNAGTLVTTGANADQLAGTDITDSATAAATGSSEATVLGEYFVGGLVEGDYFLVQQSTVTGQTPPAPIPFSISAAQAAGTQTQLVDDFSTTQFDISSAGATLQVEGNAAATEAVGGNRDLRINRTSAGGSMQINVDPNVSGGTPVVDGAITFGSSGGATGLAEIIYDGPDDTNTAGVEITPTGLGSVSLSGSSPVDPLDPGGADREARGAGVIVRTNSENANGELLITIYTDAANFSTKTITLPVTTEFTEQFVTFDGFVTAGGNGADFRDIGAIVAAVQFTGDNNDVDVAIVEGRRPGVVTGNLANIQPLSLGGEIFVDNGPIPDQNNGMRDTGEPLVTSPITVQLYRENDIPGTDTPVDTTTTSSGVYTFNNIVPGNYFVVIPQAMFDAGGPLQGFASSTGNDPAPDPNDDVDLDDNGTSQAGIGIVSGVITLASGTEPTNDGDDANKNSTLDFGVVPQTDLAITKTLVGAPPSNVTAGSTAIFDIVVTNSGPSPATDVRVQDVIPAGLTFVRTQNGPSGMTQNVNGTNLEVILGAIPASGQQTFQIVTTVDVDGLTNITNTATVTGAEFDFDTSNNSSDADVIVDPDFDIVVVKTVDDADVQPTDTVTYTVTLTNDGPSTANGVVLSDIVPTGLTFVSGTMNGNNATLTGSTVSFPAIDVGAGVANAVSATLIFTVDALATGQITNTATVPDMSADGENDITNNSDDVVITVTPDFDIVVDKTADVTTVQPNDTVIYTVTLTNDGPSTADNVVLTDVIPAGLTLVSAVMNGTDGTVSGSNITFPGVAIASGAANAVTATLTFTVNSDASGDILNTASVPDMSADGENDITNNSDDVSITVLPVFDVVVDKTVNVTNAQPNDTVIYTVTLTNNGPSSAANVVLSDAVPAGLTFVSGSLNGQAGTLNGSTVSFPAISIDSGTANAATATLTFTVNADATGQIVNTATVPDMSADGETDITNNSDDVTLTINPDFDIVVDKTVDNATPKPNDTVVYTVTLTNEGPSAATNVVLTDVVPTGLTFVSATLDGVAGTLSNGIVTFPGVAIDSGAANAATATLTFTVNAGATGQITNTASVPDMSAAGENDITNNSDTAAVTIQPDFDIIVDKTVNNATPAPGSNVTYTVTLTNEGPSVANGVVLSDAVPTGLTFVSGTLNGQAATLTGSNVTFPAVNVLAGTGNALTATLTFTVSGTASGQIVNTAQVPDLSANGENDITNNSDDAVITVTPVADIAVSKTVDKTNARIGDTLQYTVTVTNNGPSSAAAVQAVDTLPAGVTFVSGTGPNNTTLSASNGVVTVPGGTLASGASFSFIINATVNSGVTANQVNNVSVSTSTSDSNSANNSASATTGVDPATSRVDGFVFIDANNNKIFDAGETPVSGVQIQLTGTDAFGNAVNLTDTTDATGQYAFENLLAGSAYRLQRIDRPSNLRDGGEQAGSNATSTIDDVDNVFASLGLSKATSAEDFNFGLLTAALSKRDFLASS